MFNEQQIDDLKLIIKDYKDNTLLVQNDNLDSFINEIEIVFSCLYVIDELNTDYFKQLIKDYCFKKQEITPPIYSDEDIKNLILQITELKKIKQPDQRTPEWYKFRNNRLTASDLGTALNKNKYTTRDKLIAKKCGYEEVFFKTGAIEHGVKYEPVATTIYERRNNLIIDEYGCLPHPEIDYFGASPDGIVSYDSKNRNYIGRMLEIKCPKSRKIDGIIPEHYELQIQGQLEVCNLEYCDYLECSIKEYPSMFEFLEDSADSKNVDKTKNNMEKGIVIELYDNELKKNEYIYFYDFKTHEDISKWEEEEIEKIFENDKYDYVSTTYWYLNVYSCVLVQRDQPRFEGIKQEIKKFWDDVLKYREIGYESLIKKKPKKEKKFVSKENTKNEVLEFLSDSN